MTLYDAFQLLFCSISNLKLIQVLKKAIPNLSMKLWFDFVGIYSAGKLAFPMQIVGGWYLILLKTCVCVWNLFKSILAPNFKWNCHGCKDKTLRYVIICKCLSASLSRYEIQMIIIFDSSKKTLLKKLSRDKCTCGGYEKLISIDPKKVYFDLTDKEKHTILFILMTKNRTLDWTWNPNSYYYFARLDSSYSYISSSIKTYEYQNSLKNQSIKFFHTLSIQRLL